MPDVHAGAGCVIGFTADLGDKVIPNIVGVDIGCGMLCAELGKIKISLEKLDDIIKNHIPCGMNTHEGRLVRFPKIQELHCYRELKDTKRFERSIGTLGGGNHFIEIQKGDDNHIWFMIHSGSRNLGKQVADHYNKIAIELCKKWKQNEVIENDLAFLPIGTKEAELYIREMNFCLDFSFENRKHMAKVIMKQFVDIIGDVYFGDTINIQHNYAALENHYSQNVWVHRKGATLARENTIGIIPGSQGTSSYIVQGLGNKASLNSCSHGAGRKMSRKKAIENLSFEDECKMLNEKGVLHAIRGKQQLDEAPSAYKDIDVVMEEQKDLVKILVKLEPLACVKG